MTASRAAGRTPARRSLRGAGALAAVLTALLLAGCTSANGSGSDAVSTLEPGADGGAGQSEVLTERAPSDVPGSTTDVQSSDRDVITTGSMSITVDDPIAAAQDAANLTERAGGRVDSRSESPGTATAPASANLTLRIPSAALDRTLAELKRLGVLNSVSLTAADVTAQSQDLDARIRSLQTSVDRLLELLSTATDTTDLIAIESALSTRQADLESLQAQRTALSDQIDYSTVSLDLYSEGVLAPASPDTFFTGLLTGWNALLATLSGLLVGIGVVLPWLISIAVLTAIGVSLVWMSRKHRKAN
ncbi:MAG: DUF4349 domain-containing protein [Cryobacterium sp.]